MWFVPLSSNSWQNEGVSFEIPYDIYVYIYNIMLLPGSHCSYNWNDFFLATQRNHSSKWNWGRHIRHWDQPRAVQPSSFRNPAVAVPGSGRASSCSCSFKDLNPKISLVVELTPLKKICMSKWLKIFPNSRHPENVKRRTSSVKHISVATFLAVSGGTRDVVFSLS